MAQRACGQLDKAEAMARKLARRGGETNPRAFHLLGLIARDRGRIGRAVQLFEKARDAAPTAPDILCDLGNTLKQDGRHDEAVACHRAVARLLPFSAPALSNLGIALNAAGQSDEALTHLSKSVELAPRDPEFRYNLGNALLTLGDAHAAEAAFRDALARAPGHVRSATNLGATLRRQGRLNEARDMLHQAVTAAPENADARWNLALAQLMAGDFAAGWENYEARRAMPGFAVRHFDAPGWDGALRNGRTLLVHAEQGLGDCLQFCRYLHRLDSTDGTVLFQAPDRLVPMLAPLFPEISIIGAGKRVPRFDLHAPLMSLPHLTGPAEPFWPRDGAYLRAEDPRVDYWRERLGASDGPTIAIAWQGNPDYETDKERSAPLAAFSPLAEIPGIRLIALQHGAGTEQIADVPWREKIVDLGDGIDADGAFLDSAAIMAIADAVVSTDTASLHLAGGLGFEALSPLARVPDWRWGLDGDTTGWYPSVTLFRQEKAGDWTAPFAQIAERIAG
ncbi:MAG: tetratricopeptide repeat protein [Alphaproteobacteria bacterium]